VGEKNVLPDPDEGLVLSVPENKAGEVSSNVRALVRGLEILRYINLAGSIAPGRLAAELGLPRSTVYRLLQTLEAEGYIAISASSNHVRVTHMAAELGDAYSVSSAMCQAAGKVFQDYAQRVVWPLDISVHRDGHMNVQESTHGRSPMSIDRGMVGYPLPMLRTAAGRCYLSFCEDMEREAILEHLRRKNAPEDQAFLDPAQLTSMIQKTRERGMGIRDAGEFRAKTASFAVPVRVGEVVAGCVALIWIRTAITLQRAIDLYEEHLREIADRLAKGAEAASMRTSRIHQSMHL
jgi:IclR family mhp operon transcriptional activator